MLLWFFKVGSCKLKVFSGKMQVLAHVFENIVKGKWRSDKLQE
jgi:hypothetical protein